MLRVDDLELKTNPKHSTTRGRTTVDGTFRNKTAKTGVYMTTYS